MHTVFIMTIDGHTFPLEVEHYDTVQVLKEKIAKVFRLLVDRFVDGLRL